MDQYFKDHAERQRFEASCRGAPEENLRRMIDGLQHYPVRQKVAKMILEERLRRQDAAKQAAEENRQKANLALAERMAASSDIAAKAATASARAANRANWISLGALLIAISAVLVAITG